MASRRSTRNARFAGWSAIAGFAVPPRGAAVNRLLLRATGLLEAPARLAHAHREAFLQRAVQGRGHGPATDEIHERPRSLAEPRGDRPSLGGAEIMAKTGKAVSATTEQAREPMEV